MKIDLEAIQALADRLEKQDKEGYGARLQQMEQTYADMLEKQDRILELLAKTAGTDTKGIADALRSVKFGDHPITVNLPEIKIPSATVTQGKGPVELYAEADTDPTGHTKGWRIKVVK